MKSTRLVPLMLLCLCGTLRAQDSLPSFAVPHDPAFVYLGLTPAVTEAGTPRKLAVALVNGVTAAGTLKPGVAVSLQPLRLVRFVPDADAYYGDMLYRALLNMQVSLGTAAASGDTGSTDLALGARFILLDRDNPFTSRQFVASLATAIGRQCADTAAPPPQLAVIQRRSGVKRDASGDVDSGRTIAQDTVAIADVFFTPQFRRDCVAKVRDREAGRWSKQHWNDWTLAVGLATGERFAHSRLDAGRVSGWSLWAVGGVPLGRRFALQWQAQHDARSDTASRTASANAISGRLLGGGAGARGFVQGTWTSAHGTSVTTASVGVDVRVSAAMWLSAGMGDVYDVLSARRRSVVFSGIRWGMAGAPMELR